MQHRRLRGTPAQRKLRGGQTRFDNKKSR